MRAAPRRGNPSLGSARTHPEALFAALAANGLTTNLEKCVFAVPTLGILGHTISAAGAAPYGRTHRRNRYLPPPPQDIKQLPPSHASPEPIPATPADTASEIRPLTSPPPPTEVGGGGPCGGCLSPCWNYYSTGEHTPRKLIHALEMYCRLSTPRLYI